MAPARGAGLSAPNDGLPPLISLEVGGDWSAYVELVYSHFQRDFLTDDVPRFEGFPVSLAEPTLEDGKPRTFWHIITREQPTGERRPDTKRCERIRWIRQLVDLTAAGSAQVIWWRKRHGRDQRIEMALADFSYLVVLSERRERILLITAYPVDYRHERKKLRKRWTKLRES